jgi:poly-gamma-glutamate capsule biosynthesis protein CapA/YwtB (metallophosphatase superfamily)
MKLGLSREIPTQEADRSSPITISLCGDVMTGRGIDQVLPHPGNPELYEPYVRDAREYVEMAENANGPIPRPVDDSYVWGYALEQWNRANPDVRLANLETSVTVSDDFWRGKGVHYRMHPKNVGCLKAAGIDCYSLANNHVLDWGYAGLEETLETLRAAGLNAAGAGTNRFQAETPAILDVSGKGRVIVFSFGSRTSGIPGEWSASAEQAGVNLLDDMSQSDVERIQRDVSRIKSANDVVVASIHWGANWVHDIPDAQTWFAHRLIDEAGIDVVHGHSSHHIQGIEVYRGRLIIYGCGDFLDDYEGICGYEEFRDDLGGIYFADVEPRSGRLVRFRITPTQIRRMRIMRPSNDDILWLRDTINRQSERFRISFELADDQTLILKTASVQQLLVNCHVRRETSRSRRG